MNIESLKKFMRCTSETLEEIAGKAGLENVNLSISFCTVRDDYRIYSIECTDGRDRPANDYEPHWLFCQEKYCDQPWTDKTAFYNGEKTAEEQIGEPAVVE